MRVRCGRKRQGVGVRYRDLRGVQIISSDSVFNCSLDYVEEKDLK